MSIKASTAAAILGSALVCAGACDSSRSASPSVSLTEKDSAGVRVVSHAQGPIGQIARREPALEIGREGDPSYEFFGTTDVVALGSGNIVVMNGGSDELRFYDPLGNHLRSVGRSGDGPAEFRFLSRLSMRPGDTLMAVDPQRRRLVYFDSAGTFVRGESYAADLTSDMPGAMCTFPGLVGVLGDGARVVRGWGCMAFAGSDGVRPTMTTITIAREELRDTVGSIRAYTVWERASEEMGPDYFDLIPLGPVISWATGPDRIFLSEGVDPEIRVHDAKGRLVEIWREAGVPPLVTERDREAYREQQVAYDAPHPDDVPFPERRGAYDRFVLSHEGELWARWMPSPSETMASWSVFSQDGRTLRRVLLPSMELAAVRAGRMYGVSEDDLGIKSIVALEGAGAP